jgi:hypothetical protein
VLADCVGGGGVRLYAAFTFGRPARSAEIDDGPSTKASTVACQRGFAQYLLQHNAIE